MLESPTANMKRVEMWMESGLKVHAMVGAPPLTLRGTSLLARCNLGKDAKIQLQMKIERNVARIVFKIPILR